MYKTLEHHRVKRADKNCHFRREKEKLMTANFSKDDIKFCIFTAVEKMFELNLFPVRPFVMWMTLKKRK